MEITDKITELLKERDIHLFFNSDYARELYTEEYLHPHIIGSAFSHKESKKFYQGLVTLKLGSLSYPHKKIPVTEYFLYYYSTSIPEIISHSLAFVYPDMLNCYQKPLLEEIVTSLAILPEKNQRQKIKVILPLPLEKFLDKKHLQLYLSLRNNPEELDHKRFLPPTRIPITKNKNYFFKHLFPENPDKYLSKNEINN